MGLRRLSQQIIEQARQPLPGLEDLLHGDLVRFMNKRGGELHCAVGFAMGIFWPTTLAGNRMGLSRPFAPRVF